MFNANLKERLKLRRSHPDVGFTLIELLIVIVILAILAAIVVFAVGTTGSNAAVSACKADAKSVETAVEAYRAQNNNAWPTALSDLTGTGASGSPYLRSVPGTAHYTISIGSSGAVLVGGPGTAGTANFDTNTTACEDNAK